ncbi:MAG: NAD(P)/FAD-dependent oxidoreductase [Polyangiales bacterium]
MSEPSSRGENDRLREAYHDAESFDVVVVGGGPGGSTTAARLAQRGRRVVLLERQQFPRFHIGESLLPSSAPLLRALGVEAELDRRFVRKHSARFLDDAVDPDNPLASARYQFSEAFPPSTPYAWQVSRDQFDEILLRNASRLGVDVREGWTVLSALREGDTAMGTAGTAGTVVGVVAKAPDGGKRIIRAKVVVDASGREAFLAKHQGAKTRLPGLDKTAIFSHVQGGHRNSGIDEGQIEIIILDGTDEGGSNPGWAWFIPFRDGRSSVGFVVSSEVIRKHAPDAGPHLLPPALGHPRENDLRPADSAARIAALFHQLLARSPWMKRLIGTSPFVGPVRAAADYSFRVGELAGAGWLAVGDSAGFLDPLFSSGAHLAMGGGDRAAEAIDEALRNDDVSAARFAPYARSVRNAGELFLGAVQSFYRGELRSLLFSKDQRPALRRTITSMLAGDVFHPHEGAALWVGYFRQHFPPRL